MFKSCVYVGKSLRVIAFKPTVNYYTRLISILLTFYIRPTLIIHQLLGECPYNTYSI